MVMLVPVFDFLKRLMSKTPANPLPERAEWLVVGLGNPGAKYEATKHNVGFMAVDHSATDLRPVQGVKAAVQVIDGVAWARPSTFMNLSGEAVVPLARRLGVPPERVVVIHDELDLPAGKVRVKRGGNENGHNGLKSITERLGTRDYVRVRVGIGRPPKGTPVPDWVLGPVSGDEAISTAAEAAELVCAQGLSAAQNEIHARK